MDFDVAVVGFAAVDAALRVRVVVVLTSSFPALALAFFAEAVDLVDAARVVFLTTGVADSVAEAAMAGSAFFLGLLAGAAAAVLFVLIFFFGTLSVAVLVALVAFAAVDAERSWWALGIGIAGMHRKQRERSCGLRTREAMTGTAAVLSIAVFRVSLVTVYVGEPQLEKLFRGSEVLPDGYWLRVYTAMST